MEVLLVSQGPFVRVRLSSSWLHNFSTDPPPLGATLRAVHTAGSEVGTGPPSMHFKAAVESKRAVISRLHHRAAEERWGRNRWLGGGRWVGFNPDLLRSDEHSP